MMFCVPTLTCFRVKGIEMIQDSYIKFVSVPITC